MPLNFLFVDWTLDTPLKILLAMLATFFLGVATELVVSIRKRKMRECMRMARQPGSGSSNNAPLLQRVGRRTRAKMATM